MREGARTSIGSPLLPSMCGEGQRVEREQKQGKGKKTKKKTNCSDIYGKHPAFK